MDPLEKIKQALAEEATPPVPTPMDEEAIGHLLGGLNQPLFVTTGRVRFKRDREENKETEMN